MRFLENNLEKGKSKEFKTSLFPRFGNQIVSDIRENKAVIYEYDQNNFISAYRAIVDIDNLYKRATDRFEETSQPVMGFNREQQTYLFAVSTLGQWAGSDLRMPE